MIATLLALAVLFAELSLLAFGGGNTVVPEMQRQVVSVHHWMTTEEFGALYALAQAAPGPNLMVVILIGWRVAGWWGALVVGIAKFGPSSILTAGVSRLWDRHRERAWRRVAHAALAPITIGLVASSAAVMVHTTVHDGSLALIVLVSVAATLMRRIHPLWLLGGGAFAGLAGWV